MVWVCNRTGLGRAYRQKNGKGQAKIASKDGCLGANGRFKRQLLSMSEGCHYGELPSEVSRAWLFLLEIWLGLLCG